VIVMLGGSMTRPVVCDSITLMRVHDFSLVDKAMTPAVKLKIDLCTAYILYET